MCRLCLFNEGWLEDCSTSVLADYFHYLEKRQGGDGIGVAGYKRGYGVKVYKGVLVKPMQASETVMRWRDGGYSEFLFHTRMTTSGHTNDINCQPFKIAKGSAMAHNGHNHEYVAHESPVSDSYLMALAMRLDTLTIPQLRKCHGTFVGWFQGQPFAVSDGIHDIELDLDEDNNAWCIASDIPSGMRQGAFYDAGAYLWIGRRTRTQYGVLEAFPDAPTTSRRQYDNWGDCEYGRSATVYTPKASKTHDTLSWPSPNGVDTYWGGLSPEERLEWEEWVEEQERDYWRSKVQESKKLIAAKEGDN